MFYDVICFYVSQPYDDGDIQFDVIYSYEYRIICTKNITMMKMMS